MRRTSSTVVCVVGDDAVAQIARGLARAPNVAHVADAPEPPDSPSDVAAFVRTVRALYDRAGAAQSPYALTVADPLAPVREAWRRRFSDGVDAVEEFVGAARGHAIELPDYYLVVGAKERTLTLEWYAGLVRDVRASRVVVVPHAEPGAAAGLASHALGRLPSGPWWPPVERILDAARMFVPVAGRPDPPGV